MSDQLTRRRVLRTLAASLAAIGFNPGLLAKDAGQNSSASAVQFGAQTNAFAIQPAQFDSFLRALDEIKGAGYDGFETSFINLRSQSKTLAEARKRIAAAGLTFIGVHIFLSEYDALTNLPPKSLYEIVAHQGAEIGAQRLIFSGNPAVTPDEIKRKSDALNIAGDFVATLCLKLAYHNHWWEAKYKAKELEALFAETDPAKVSFLMDIGHASRTDLDLPDFVQRHASRLIGLHFRDFVDGKQVPLGQGHFPLKQVASALKQASWRGWVINEEERENGEKLGLTVLEPSLRSLKGAFSA